MISLLFFPYLIVYLVGWVTNSPVRVLNLIFWFLHLINLGWVISLAWRSRSKMDWVSAGFWGILSLCFLLPGAYLEYPSDTWEHFRRLTSWNSLSQLLDSDSYTKFTYFWGWTFFSKFPIAELRIAVDFYSAFWQLLLSGQVYLLIRKLGFSRESAYLQILGFFCLFGSNVFSFRYYALASTTLAYIAFLQAVTWLLEAEEGKRWRLLLIGFVSVPLMGFNHLQEPIFFLLAAAVILVFSFFKRLPKTQRRVFFLALTLLLVLGFISGPFLVKYLPQVYAKAWLPSLSRFSSFRIWQRNSVYAETYGVHGYVSLLLCLLFFRKHSLICLLSLAPTGALLWPPTALLIARVLPDHYSTYRILFAFPLSIVLVLSLEECFRFFTRFFPVPLSVQWIAVVLILGLISFNPRYPWRGRLFFQFYRPPKLRALVPQVEAAIWLEENRIYDSKLPLFSDPITTFALTTYLGRSLGDVAIPAHRIDPILFLYWQQQYGESSKLASFFTRDRDVGGILLVDMDRLPADSPSRIGELSHHWQSFHADFRFLLKDIFYRGCEELLHRGWTKTRVPPFYWLYEPRGGFFYQRHSIIRTRR